VIPEFLTREDALEIHSAQLDQFGGGAGLRDEGLLISALAQPEATAFGNYLHHDMFEMAAAYLFHVVSNHPFLDGNKRTGLVCALVFLDLTRSYASRRSGPSGAACGRPSSHARSSSSSTNQAWSSGSVMRLFSGRPPSSPSAVTAVRQARIASRNATVQWPEQRGHPVSQDSGRHGSTGWALCDRESMLSETRPTRCLLRGSSGLSARPIPE
jgi:death-on-curing family protein